MTSTTDPARPAAAATIAGGPVAPSTSVLRPLPLDQVRIRGGFWGERQELNARTTIAHCQTWMERIGWIANFDAAAAGTVAQRHHGIEFVDSEVYKLLEAMAWELGREHSDDLAARYDALAERVAAAQEPDGYLHTSFGRPGQRPRYSDLEWGHELYSFGHLLQAATARLRTGHDDRLVEVARALADHVWSEFGPAGRDAVCGHPEIEVALAEFSRATGEPRYLELARIFVERRGRRQLATTLFQGSEYFLDDVPVRDAEVLRGHAVRALYLAAGAADVAVETGDDELLEAVKTQWANTVARRTYITGGMGSHHQNEEFGSDFELPPDRAYSETCASIASVMLGWRLLLQTGEARYADLIERTLFNAFAVSPREDGRAFYYANTLHQREHGSEPSDDELSERAEASLRAPWFEVSCCPTNVARTLASLAGYFVTVGDASVQVHQYADLDVDTRTADGTPVAFSLRTGYPFEGGAELTVREAGRFRLQLRIPEWARGSATASVNGEEVPVDGAYLTVDREFAAGDVVALTLDLRPRLVLPSPRIDAVRGTVAIERGPFVLCLESVDLPPEAVFEELRIDPAARLRSTADGAIATMVTGGAPDDAGTQWPYAAAEPGHADQPGHASTTRFEAELHPYFAWANRGPSLMRVWLPRA
ncbi:glycoside hydrolase family 127 protein [Leifsonia shinshuensis]|uniref:glycoside hydrolase family 127 protein n=1 Tax=Leifsonia shinshuensis TaxID=150026 RepID=UPI001F5124B6|nr:beta-L-arabinofuranosidase domain-containing protein [Leifsonia shinshuensis]MCI0157674.1 glycoside hydrolase family 127 protein [Leifsonia shinshuensis]